jgi:hypothetical protein
LKLKGIEIGTEIHTEIATEIEAAIWFCDDAEAQNWKVVTCVEAEHPKSPWKFGPLDAQWEESKNSWKDLHTALKHTHIAQTERDQTEAKLHTALNDTQTAQTEGDQTEAIRASFASTIVSSKCM